MNNVSLIGNISNDIDIKVTPQGHQVAKFSLAVNSPYNRDKTSFIPIEVWRKQAENVSAYCSKGSKVGVIGHIEIDSYEKDGQRKTFTKVIANNVEFLTPKRERSEQTGETQRENSPAPQQSYQTNNSYTNQGQAQTRHGTNYTASEDPFQNGKPAEIDDSDLPF